MEKNMETNVSEGLWFGVWGVQVLGSSYEP